MKKILLLTLGASALLLLLPASSQADGIRLSVGPGYSDQGGYPDGYYHRRPHYYSREYRQDDSQNYVYRNGHRYHRVHRHYDNDDR